MIFPESQITVRSVFYRATGFGWAGDDPKIIQTVIRHKCAVSNYGRNDEMDFLIQLVLELIIDGSIASVGDKRTPPAVRVIAAVILIAVFCGLVGLSLFLIIKDTSMTGKAGGGLILLITLFMTYRFFAIYRQRNKRQ